LQWLQYGLLNRHPLSLEPAQLVLLVRALQLAREAREHPAQALELELELGPPGEERKIFS